jgi:UDPglucose--hexose-1-phosphate uridylyltransferase
MLEGERQSGKRVIFENEDFIVFLPYFSECPYGIYVAAKKHIQNLTQLDDTEGLNLAKTIKDVVGSLDALFGFTFPYMMCMHQNPVNGEDCSEYYHFHIEFFSPLRSANKQKYNASGETGAWAHVNPTLPEEKAEELRIAYRRFISTRK